MMMEESISDEIYIYIKNTRDNNLVNIQIWKNLDSIA